MHANSITVVMPTNRGGPFLDEAVSSVRSQTVPVAEIILVDDGSPPPGLEQRARDLGLTYVRQPPSGISAARNAGVAAAASQWIAFLDDDDIWHPERLEAQLRAIAKRPESVASHTGGWFMDEKGARFGEDWPAPTGTSGELISAAVVPPRIPTFLVRRDVYLAVGGCDPSMEPFEDNELIIRVLRRGPSAPVDRPLVGYRRHSANLTHRGLRGRIAGQRSLRRVERRARAAGDVELAELIVRRRRVFRREAASENLGELISALRGRDWPYASRVAWWGVSGAPVESLRAARERAGRRRRR